MENRLDVNENHYKNLLEKNEAKEHVTYKIGSNNNAFNFFYSYFSAGLPMSKLLKQLF